MDNFVKITEELYCSENFNIRDNLTKRVDKIFSLNSSDCEIHFIESLLDCESPIEQLLSIALTDIGITDIMSFNPFIDVIEVEKQKEYTFGGKTFRADFTLPTHFRTLDGKDIFKHYIIECDGHEFHQKTKEQVERDNERTRLFQQNGYEVLRYSGTEVYHKSHQCAFEIRRKIINDWLRLIGVK